MTEIHVLPTLGNCAELERQFALLDAAVAQGIELGPRGHHVRALGETLVGSMAGLQQALTTCAEVRAVLATYDVRLDLLGHVEASLTEMLERGTELA